MIIKSANHEITAVKPHQYPVTMFPEVAFVGRSNVGKSSIINIMVNRKNLARVGSTPGKTRVINFYNINNSMYLVDLPGYGYANVSKGEKESWAKIIETYLFSREQLKLLILLVDIRHKPTGDDKMIYDWMVENNIPHIVVATKLDKITRSQINIRLKEIRETLELQDGVKIIPFSALNRQGKDDVWNTITEFLGLQQ